MKDFLLKVKHFLEKLSSRPKIGGLQISDSVIQYVLIDNQPRIFSLRLPPGIIKEGRVQNSEQLLVFMKQLRSMVETGKPDLRVPVVVTLPSALVYSQSFNIPNVGQEKIDEAVELNLQMISPIPREQAYMSWQRLSETSENYELLGAFADKANIDKFREALELANFSPIAFEFPSLALARLIDQVMSATSYPVLVFQISSDGLNLFVLRNGSVYFDYFRSWRSIQGDNREISKAVFNEVVTQEVQKVINFAQNKYRENLEQVFLVAPGFELEMQAFLEKHFSLRVMPLRLRSWSLTPSWYVALGSALRGMIDRSQDRSITLTPINSVEMFYQEQTFDFIRLWRNFTIGVLIIFLIAFSGSAYFLVSQSKSLKRQINIFNDQTKVKELADLRAKVTEFNGLVKAVEVARGATNSWYSFLEKLNKLASDNKISLSSIIITGPTAPINLIGRSPDYDTIVRFKNTLSAQPNFSGVDLIVSKITTLEDNTVLFQLVFLYQF
jgi:hypothetical protein